MKVANPQANADEVIRLIHAAQKNHCAALVLPELTLTGYSCGDLFEQRVLLQKAEQALACVLTATKNSSMVVLVGMPVRVQSRLFNTAAVIQNGRILGLAGKTYLPNYREFYEKRHFRSVREYDGTPITLCGQTVPLGNRLVFDAGNDFVFGVELCEDMWAVIPPSASLALGGAKLIFNLSAGPELVAKAQYRKSLVTGLSARYACIYAFAGAGVHESTTDLVFSGHAMISENGRILSENERFEQAGALIFAEVKPAWMEQQRRAWTSFNDVPSEPVQRIAVAPVPMVSSLKFRALPPFPFVPANTTDRAERCQEIFSIQATGLAQRITHTNAKRMVVGLSGGLDSTLALLVCAKCCDLLKLPRHAILAITMPGMGTSGRTYDNACNLAREVGAELREISIKKSVLQHFKDIGHAPDNLNVVYENAQARERTQILMDLANEVGGLVIGTGDLSEIALGWSTFNGDHISMYAVNCGVPKSLVRYLVEYCASISETRLAATLRDINATPVSPELLPGGNQKTEGILGSYTLHDFFLYYFLRYSESPENLQALAEHAFHGQFKKAEIKRALELFVRRFFNQQFKRNCMPDGPKVGTIALSPRGDWRMPSDASAEPWNL